MEEVVHVSKKEEKKFNKYEKKTIKFLNGKAKKLSKAQGVVNNLEIKLQIRSKDDGIQGEITPEIIGDKNALTYTRDCYKKKAEESRSMASSCRGSDKRRYSTIAKNCDNIVKISETMIEKVDEYENKRKEVYAEKENIEENIENAEEEDLNKDKDEINVNEEDLNEDKTNISDEAAEEVVEIKDKTNDVVKEKQNDDLGNIREVVDDRIPVSGNNGGEEVPSLLNGIDEKYYKNIFSVINNTIVLGDKNKFNTLENLEYTIKNSDPKRMKELGFPVVENPEKANLIKDVLLKFVDISKEIRRDQWMSSKNENKKGTFEARKHSTSEAAVDRNIKLVNMLKIPEDKAREYGLSLSVEELEQSDNKKQNAAKRAVKKVKDEEKFIEFYNKLKDYYKLGDASGKVENTLNNVYKDLLSEQNSFGLEGDALKAAIEVVKREIVVRRNTWHNGTQSSKQSLEDERKNLGLDELEK